MSRWSRRFANGAWLRGGWDTMNGTFETNVILPVERLMNLNPGLEVALARLYQYAKGKLTRDDLDKIASLAYRYDSALMQGGPEGQALLAYVRSELKRDARIRRYVMYLRRLVHLGDTKPPKFEEIVQERADRRSQLKLSPWFGSDGYDAAGKRQRTYVGLSGFAIEKPKRVKPRKAPRINAALDAIRAMTAPPPEVASMVAGTPGYNNIPPTPGYNNIPPTPGDGDIIYPGRIPNQPDEMSDEAMGSGYYRF